MGVSGSVRCIPLHPINCLINAYAEAAASAKLANYVTYRRWACA